MLQRENPKVFQAFYESYAAEHSPSRAHYMKQNLQFWDSGKVEIQSESLSRFESVRFPKTSVATRRVLMSRYVEDESSVRMRSFSVDLRIESGLEQSIARLREIVRDFRKTPYNFYIGTDFYDGMLWVLDGDESTFWKELDQYIRPHGETAFNELSQPIEAFIYLVESSALPIPLTKTFPYAGGKLEIDYNHSFGTRLVGRLKFWKSAPTPPAVAPESERKFACPSPSCKRVMVLTPEEFRANVFACPYCWKYGTTTPDAQNL